MSGMSIPVIGIVYARMLEYYITNSLACYGTLTGLFFNRLIACIQGWRLALKGFMPIYYEAGFRMSQDHRLIHTSFHSLCMWLSRYHHEISFL